MHEKSDRKFDWVAAMALASGTAVMIPSLVVVAIAVITVGVAIFW